MTSNEYTVKDTFVFADKIVEQDPEFFIGSLDVDSLFTNIPLEETFHIRTNTLFENTERVEGLSKIEFKELLSLATKESYFIFNEKLYKLVDGVTMGSALIATLTDGFLVYFKKSRLQNYPSDIKPYYYWGYVDYIFVLFTRFRILPKFSKWPTC